MATVPYNEGVPTVTPTTNPPNDYQNIQTSPNMFGGYLAQGEKELGQGLKETSDTGFQLLDMYHNIADDRAINNYTQAYTELLHGKPGAFQMGVDGVTPVLGPDNKPIPDNGLSYFRDKGEDYLKVLPKIQERARQLQQQYGEGLTLKGSIKFNNGIRQFNDKYAAGEISTGTRGAMQQWGNAVAQQQSSNAAQRVALAPEDDNLAQHEKFEVADALVKQAQHNGIAMTYDAMGNPDINDPNTVKILQDADLRATQYIAVNRINSLLGAQNGPGAKRVFLQNEKELSQLPGEDYNKLSKRVQAGALDSDAADILKGVLNKSFPQTQGVIPTGVSPQGTIREPLPPTTQSAADFTQGFENTKQTTYHAYRDGMMPDKVTPRYSIGFGTLANSPDETISFDEAKTRSNIEINKASQVVKSLATVPLSEDQQKALTDFQYNLGSLTKSGIMDKVNAGDLEGAAQLIRSYSHVTQPDGTVVNSAALQDRRNKEAQLLTGKPGEDLDTFDAHYAQSINTLEAQRTPQNSDAIDKAHQLLNTQMQAARLDLQANLAKAKQANDDAVNTASQQIYQNVTDFDIKAFNNDSRVNTFRDRQAINNLYEDALSTKTNGPKGLGLGYDSVTSDIFSGKINSLSQLMTQVKPGGLSSDGYFKASNVLNQLQADKNQGASEQAKIFQTQILPAMLFPNKLSGMPLNVEETERLSNANRTISNIVQANGNSANPIPLIDFFTPTSPNYVGKALQQFTPSVVETAQSLIGAGLNSPSGLNHEAWVEAIAKRPEGVDVVKYTKDLNLLATMPDQAHIAGFKQKYGVMVAPILQGLGVTPIRPPTTMPIIEGP